MLNCNPETVSTDYDTSSRLYFEPLTVRSVCKAASSVALKPTTTCRAAVRPWHCRLSRCCNSRKSIIMSKIHVENVENVENPSSSSSSL